MTGTEALSGEGLDGIGRPIVIATHPRSGTHLTIDLLRRQFGQCQVRLRFGETVHRAYLNLDHLSPDSIPHIEVGQALSALRRALRMLVKTHSVPGLLSIGDASRPFAQQLLEGSDVLHVVRDGRDVMCSAYLWLRKHEDPACGSLSRFIREETDGMSRARYWAHHAAQWLSAAGAEPIQFEQMVRSPRPMLERIGRELALEPLFAEPLLPRKTEIGSRWHDYWLRLTRQYESSSVLGRRRGVEPPKWREAFAPADRRFFHDEAGEMLVGLGYERDDGWVKAPDDQT